MKPEAQLKERGHLNIIIITLTNILNTMPQWAADEVTLIMGK